MSVDVAPSPARMPNSRRRAFASDETTPWSPAQLRRRPVAADELRLDRARVVAIGERHRKESAGEEVDGRLYSSELAVLRQRERARLGARAELQGHHHEAVGVAEGEWAQKQGIHHADGRGIGARCQRETDQGGQ